MFYMINTFIPTFAEILLMFLFVQKSSSKEILHKWYWILLIINAIIISLCKLVIPWPIVVSILSLLITYAIICLINQSPPNELLLNYITSCIFIVFLVEIPVLYIVKSLATNSYYMAISGVIILLWGVLLISIIPLHSLFNILKEKSLRAYIIIVDCSVIAILFTWYFQIKRTSFYENIIFILFFSILIIFVNYELIASYVKMRDQAKRIETYQEYYPILNEMILAVREKQHNYNDIINTIINLPSTHRTYDDLVMALTGKDVLSLISSTPTYLLKTNLTVVAAYLYSKSQQATTFNKALDIEIDEKDLPTHIPQYELIELLGVLIDNGLEAIPDGAGMTISLKRTEDNKIFIKSENQGPIVSSAFLKDIFTPGYTTKGGLNKKSRGLGLPKLKKYVDGHNGEVEVSNYTKSGVRMIVFTVEV